ncbi:MAG: Flp pilus assembly protein CpaB [Chloroflexi bacterium]|nr:Flp pilus assembly protein CpaB [Chloroflexota bacterium]
MQRSGRILIALGLILGLAALFVILFTFGGPTKATGPEIKFAKVVVVQRTIPMRAPIEASALTVADWPEDAVPPDTYSDPSEIVGKLAATPLVKGQVIVPALIVDKKIEETRKGIGSDASYIVPEGKVAVAFPIDALTGVAAALKDGDRVDILVSYDLSGASTAAAPLPIPGATTATVSGIKRKITQVALQDVEILRVGLWTGSTVVEGLLSGAANKDVLAQYVTFLVTPQDALVLMLLRETAAEVQLTLRAAGDHQVFKTQPVVIEYVDTRFGFGGALVNAR